MRSPSLSPLAILVLWTVAIVPRAADARPEPPPEPVAAMPLEGPPAALRVEIEGIGGELRRNALAYLSVERRASDGELMEASRARQLHAGSKAQIARALEPFGHYRPMIEGSLERDAKGFRVRYQVDPGPRVPVASMTLQVDGDGRSDEELRELVESFPVQVGDPLSHPDYSAGKDALAARAAERGYFDAEFTRAEIRLDLDRYVADIELRFATGRRYLLGPVRFNDTVLDEKVLRGYVPFEPGDPYDLGQLLRLQDALLESPVFARATVAPRPEEAADNLEVPIDVILEPRPRRRDTGGIGFSTDSGPRLRGSSEFRRLNRLGHNARAEAEISLVDRRVGLQYGIPRALGDRGLLNFEAAYQELDPDVHESQVSFTGASLSRLRGGWRERLSLRYEHHDFRVGSDSGVFEFLAPGGTWSRVRADDRFFPGRGYRVDLEIRGGLEGILTDASFVQARARAKLVRSFGPRVRMLGRLEGGLTETSEFRQLPPALRFFAGGDESVRGFGYQRLGPRDAAGDALGGRILLVGSAELEVRVWGDWGAAVFFDAGNAFDSLGDDIGQGTGFGLRWFSPIGRIRADLAFAVSEPGTPTRIHFGLGLEL